MERNQTTIPLLQNVRIAAPCHANWNAMDVVDGERVRHCGECKLNVYNLSEMTQSEAEGLLRKHEGRLCVRYYERSDGTILTRNCPVGAAMLQMQMAARNRKAALATVALIGVALGTGNLLLPRTFTGSVSMVRSQQYPEMSSIDAGRHHTLGAVYSDFGSDRKDVRKEAEELGIIKPKAADSQK